MIARFLLCVTVLVILPGGVTSAADRPPVVLTDAARELHRTCLVIDGHNDLPWEVRTKGGGSFEALDIAKPQAAIHTDIARLRQGGVGAQFWAAYAPAETARQHTAARVTLEQIDLIHQMIRRYPDTFELATTADDIVRIHKSGKIASLIGVEGGHSIENSLGVLRAYYSLGVRYMTLTHSDTLEWADSATDAETHGGLTGFGEEVVQTMNDLGMLVDISHVSAETMRDALRVSRAPLIASHSSAYSVAQHPRNVPDDVLKLVGKNRGVVMVNFYPGFVVPEAARVSLQYMAYRKELLTKVPDEAERKKLLETWRKEHPSDRGSIHDVVDHIDHITKTAGVDHVGLGSDFDGIPSVPRQLDDVSCFPLITQALLDRGYTADQIRKILGENLLRVLREAEAVRNAR